MTECETLLPEKFVDGPALTGLLVKKRHQLFSRVLARLTIIVFDIREGSGKQYVLQLQRARKTEKLQLHQELERTTYGCRQIYE